MSFQLKHIVFPVKKDCKLTVNSVFPLQIDPKEAYTITFSPFSGLKKYGLRNRAPLTEEDEAFFSQSHTLTPEGNTLSLTVSFPQEDCYICKIFVGGVAVSTLELYALEEDLFSKLPYKGDHHLHTHHSDGENSPMYMAAAACKFGYDYCVITDHALYDPSLIARDFFAPIDLDFLVIPGEEVHSPDNPVHIINLGGNDSVNAWWWNHEDEYRAAVAKEMENISEPMIASDKYAAAASQVMFDRIRGVDGVSVLCHPQWILGHGFNQHEDVTDYLFDHKRFDALELIAGGAYEVGTQMQLSYYNDRPNMPILGNSDSHACFGGGLEPGNYTITFADALDGEAIKSSIRAGLTVAADANRFYGDYRLVKYAYFLQRNYFPEHDSKRSSLGRSMLRFASARPSYDSPMADELKNIRPSEHFAPLRYTEK